VLTTTAADLRRVAARHARSRRAEVAHGEEGVIEGADDHGSEAAGEAQISQAGLGVAGCSAVGVDADFVHEASAQTATEVFGATKAQAAVGAGVLCASERERAGVYAMAHGDVLRQHAQVHAAIDVNARLSQSGDGRGGGDDSEQCSSRDVGFERLVHFESKKKLMT